MDSKILSECQFDVIAWEAVSEQASHNVPVMFQMWACKQVWGIAGTNYPRSKWDKTMDKWCPNCSVLACLEVGRVTALQWTIDLVEQWLTEVDTAENIKWCIIHYTRGRGYRTMQEVCTHSGWQFKEMAREQDIIGWRRFMEGMISKKLVCLYADFYALTGEGLPAMLWARQLVI